MLSRETEMSDKRIGELPTSGIPADHPEGAKRLPYARPKLRSYGDVGELTAGGSKPGSENGMGNMA